MSGLTRKMQRGRRRRIASTMGVWLGFQSPNDKSLIARLAREEKRKSKKEQIDGAIRNPD